MIDTHCHLQYPGLIENLPAVLDRAKEAGVTKIIVPGTGLATSESALQLSKDHPQIFAALGIHPIDDDADAGDQEAVQKLFESVGGKVVAVGEVGMDYYHLTGDPQAITEAKAQQVKRLVFFIDIARKRNLPLIVHSRDCFDDLYHNLKEHASDLKVVIHCFVGNQAEAKAWLDLGYYLSFTNIITYPKNHELREVVANIPEDRFMIETDAPFLAPRSKKGGLCEPADVVSVASCIAEARNTTLAEIERITDRNAEQFFNVTKVS